MDKVKLAVIGAGPGGYPAAFRAAELGVETVMIGLDPGLGGVCLNRGCIPSKALLHAGAILNESQDALQIGIRLGEPEVDLDKLRDWKDRVIKRLTGGLEQLRKARKVPYIQGRARFTDARTLEIESADGSRKELGFEHAIVATGSSPVVLPFLPQDSDRVWDSTAALELRTVPGSMLVIGGGYIGLEMATAYASLGSEVTVVEMLPGLMPGADRDLVNVLSRRTRKMLKDVLLETQVKEVSRVSEEADALLRVKFSGDVPEAVFETVLAAVGRKPNSANLGLEKTRAELDGKGFIRTDLQRRTAEPSIFAVGDVAGEPMLAHKATHEGYVAAEAVAGKRTAFEPAAIPGVAFTDPEIAWCGLTETQAKAERRKVSVTKVSWAASGRAVTLNRTDGLTKLVVDPETDRVLGVGIVGSGAGELISEGVLAVEMGARAADLRLTIHPHPTLSETVMDAAEALARGR